MNVVSLLTDYRQILDSNKKVWMLRLAGKREIIHLLHPR